MGKKAKVKAPKGFVDFDGRQADFLPSLKPKLAQVMHDALLRTAGIDFGEVEILNTVEAPMNGGKFLFVEMKQVGTNDPITFSIPTAQIIQVLGQGAYLRSEQRTVRHYRAAKKYKILPISAAVEPTQLYFEPPKAGDVVVDKEKDGLSVVKADGTVEPFQ